MVNTVSFPIKDKYPRNTTIILNNINTAGMIYPATNVLMMGSTFKGGGTQEIVNCKGGRAAKLKIIGSVVEDPTFVPTFTGSGVTILTKDI